MKNIPITTRISRNRSKKVPPTMEVTLDAAGKKRANFTTLGCGCTGKCSCA